MQLSELRQRQRQSSPLAIDILSDGYDYLVQVQLDNRAELLTDASGRQVVFHNLGDAEQQLRSVGIRRATLSHIATQDELVGLDEALAPSRMPLSF